MNSQRWHLATASLVDIINTFVSIHTICTKPNAASPASTLAIQSPNTLQRRSYNDTMEAFLEEFLKRAIAPLNDEIVSMKKDIASMKEDILVLLHRSYHLERRVNLAMEAADEAKGEIEEISERIDDYFNTANDDDGVPDADDDAVASADGDGKCDDVPTEVADVDRKDYADN
ncbi:hypothetical protein CFAM422_009934 [Trichoderma lentiforme]|uniref:Uncharacterized protein n=1 Tax=Trichoderma lentiforme TaxID=1567552 RepID=A0A9P4X909_9HYPO|nr:hypothetical protein CFAM422_009934 [Trichoderma lentiforme]